MEKKIFGRFRANKKWHDYYNFRSFEVRFSLISSILFIIFIFQFDIYFNFENFIPALQNISIYIATALIGMLGIILAGLAIIISVLSKDIVKSINELNSKNSVYDILISFEFLAFNIGIGILSYYFLYIGLYSKTAIFPEIIFYILSFLLSYLFFFIIFYTISLISNSIRVFYIANLYEDIQQNKKTTIDIANELRIDYILGLTLHKTTKEQFIQDLFQYVDRSNAPDKNSIKEYLKSYYQ